MGFTYGTPVPLKRKEEPDKNGFSYGKPVPLVFGDYSKASYGEPIPLIDLDPVTPKAERSIIVRRPDPEDVEELRARYSEGTRLTAADKITSSGAGGGPLGLPSKQEVLEKRYPGARAKMDALEEAAWAGKEESSWAEVFGNTLRNVLPKFRLQILGGFIGGNPVTVERMQMNADIELDQPGSGLGQISASIENQRIAKEWGFEEGSEKVPQGTSPVDAFVGWLQTEEGKAEVDAEAAKTPVAMIAEDIYDAETGKINENAIQVKPHSLKYYIAGILDGGFNMGPAMAATIITKNPNVGAVIMGGQVYGQTYGEMRKRGYSHDQSLVAGLYSAAAETLTERVSLGVLTSNKFTGLKRVLAGASAEGIQEPLTEALQIGYDVGILDDKMTMGEAMWRLIDAGIIGFGVGAGMGAGVEVLNQVSTPAAVEVNEYDQLIDTLHLSLNKKAEERRALEELEKNVEALDNAVNEQAKDLSPEQIDSMVAMKLIKIDDEGNVKVLPRGRRRLAKQAVELNRKRKKEALRSRGVSDDELGPTVEILDAQPAFSVAEVETNTEPTEQQKLAGNYKKGRFTWNGIPIALENPVGSVRSGTNAQGVQWQQTMNSGYGYFPSRPGADNVEGEPTEGVDVYVGTDLTVPTAYVINQAKDPSKEAIGDNFDEHKVMIGYPSMEAALDAYQEDYAPARGQDVDVVVMGQMQFEGWLNLPVHDKPVSLGDRDGYDTAPVFATEVDSKPTADRYRMHGTKVIGMPATAEHSLRGVNNQIDKTVAILEDSALIPDEAWNWYEDSGRMIREITRGEPELMHQIVKILATYSQATGVSESTTAMIKAAYAIARGEEIPSEIKKVFEQMRTLDREGINDEAPGIDSQLMSFYRNLYDATFNTSLYDEDVTIDRWMARNLGYKGDAVSGAQHDYAKKILQDAIKRYNARHGTNWLPRHAQAALRAHERSRSSLKKTGKETPVDSFAESVEPATAKVTHEVIPSKKTGSGQQIESMPREAKEEYTQLQQESLADGNEHKVMRALGVPLYTEEPGLGGYEGNINPNRISGIVLVDDNGKFDPEMADIFSTIMMYIHTQDSVPWFRADRHADTSKRKVSQGVNLDLRGELSEEHEKLFFDALQKELGPDAGFSMPKLDQIAIIDFKDETGVAFSGLSPDEFIAKIQRIVDNIGIEIGVIDSYAFGAEGNYLEHNWETDPNGQELERQIEDYARTAGSPDLLKRVRAWRADAQRITKTFIEVFEEEQAQAFHATREVGPGVPVEGLKAVIEEAFLLYPGSPNVKIARTEADLPKRQLIAIKHAGVEGKVGGMFDPVTGDVFLVASNLPNMKQALEIYLHEMVGHYGTRSILGAEYDTIMDKIAAAYPAKVEAAGARSRLDMNVPWQRRLAAEEFIAYTAQRVLAGETVPAREASLLKRLVEAIRIALARLRGIQMSDTDIQILIRKARLFVATPNNQAGGVGRNRRPPVMLARLWKAVNNNRVPNSAPAATYQKELGFQIRAGNILKEDATPLTEWLTAQTGLVDKAEFLEQIREIGNSNPFHIEEEVYEVIDRQTGNRVGTTYKGKNAKKRVRTRVDKLDNEYGAYRYLSRRVSPEPSTMFHVEEYDGRRDAIENGDLYENFTIPEGSRTSQAWNYLVFKAQDKFIDLLNVQKAIEMQSGRKLDENIDAYLAEVLYHGRVKARIDRFDKEYIKPLIDAIEASDYTWDEVEWYLYARHAPEANKRLYQINRSGAIRRTRDRMKKKAREKAENRLKRIGKQRAAARNKIQAEHAATLRVIESEYRSQMRRSKPSQKKKQENIEATKKRKIERADDLRAKRIDQVEAKYKTVRDDYALTYRAEIEEADTQFREKEEARVGEDPGLLALSGMSNPDAVHVMETLGEKADISQMEGIAEMVDRMTARNREIMVDEGLETQDTIDAWEAAYDHYVPLKGFKDGPMNTSFFPKKGKGYDTGGKLNQRRLGRRSLAANIMANIVAQHQSTVIMAEKAKVGRTLLEMVNKHPNPDLWTANEVEVKKRLDPKTGLVVTAIDPTYKLKDNVLRVKVDGKDYHITFNEDNQAAMRLASSMKNMSSQEINVLFRGMLSLNRVLSAVNTSFNPEFILSNITRDLQTAMINLNATDADKMKMAILKDVFKAHRGIRRFMGLPSFKNKERDDYWRDQFDEFRDLGGQVGWLDNYKDVKDLEASLYREMHDRTTGMISWATLRKMGTYIEGENQAIENAVRLSAFVHAKAAGMSPKRAASLAKNLTVNFNRKGDIGTAMNALYLFYNASIQGMSIMWKSAKSPKVRKVMYGIIAFAAALEVINRMLAGDDDDGENRYDKIPSWVKERNMIIMLPEQFQSKDPESFNDYYITIPLPYGYNMLHVVGQKIGGIIDYIGIGNKREWKPMEDATEIVSAALGSFNPIGTGPTPLQTIIPTALSPLVQVSENVAWHGGPVMPPQNPWDASPQPESQQYFRSAPKHAVALAEFLNQLGGGSKARPAAVPFMDISPETIQLWEDFLTGGAGRFVTNMVEVGIMAKEHEIDVRKVPFVRRFVGLTDERSVSDRYYSNVKDISYAVQEIKVAGEQVGLATTRSERADAMEARARIVEQYQADAALETTLKLIQNQLKTLNAQRKAVNNSKRPDEWKEEKVDTIGLKKTKLMNKFNKKYNEIRDRRREQQEQARIKPQLAGKERLAAVQQFNQAGMPATANLIGSLPSKPGQDFVSKLYA